jgi:hypothetical protein
MGITMDVSEVLWAVWSWLSCSFPAMLKESAPLLEEAIATLTKAPSNSDLKRVPWRQNSFQDAAEEEVEVIPRADVIAVPLPAMVMRRFLVAELLLSLTLLITRVVLEVGAVSTSNGLVEVDVPWPQSSSSSSSRQSINALLRGAAC